MQEDLGGVYFEGPKMAFRSVLGPPEYQDGGLYVSKDGKKATVYRVSLFGTRELFESHCDYSFESVDSCKAGPDRSVSRD